MVVPSAVELRPQIWTRRQSSYLAIELPHFEIREAEDTAGNASLRQITFE